MILSFEGRAPVLGPDARVEESAIVLGDVRLGEKASVWFGAVLRGDINRIEVGRRSNIQDGCVVHVSRAEAVRIDDDVTLGHRAVVHGARIGRGALIGIAAVVLDGAEVGEQCLVAAGAVVAPGTRLPPRTLAAGVPARVIRALNEDDLARLGEPARNYLGYAERYRKEFGR